MMSRIFGEIKKKNHMMLIELLPFLAHLSRRLTGELMGYPWSRIRPSSVICPFTFSNIFFSKTACPIKTKFYVEPPWVGGTKVCSRHLGHMTKMAATPFKNLLLQNRQADFHETWYVASGLQPIIACSNGDTGVTLTYFTARSNLVT